MVDRLLRLVFGMGLVAALTVQLAAQTPAGNPAPDSRPPASDPVQFDSASLSALAWRNIGPFRGGRVVAVAGVPQQPRTFYFGSVGGGVWKTTDGGETWSNITDGQLNTASVGAIAVAPSDPNVDLRRHGRARHPRRDDVARGRRLQIDRRRPHLDAPRARPHAAHLAHPRPPDRTRTPCWSRPRARPTARRRIAASTDPRRRQDMEQVLFVNETTGPSELAMDPTNPRILYAAMWDHLRRPWEVQERRAGQRHPQVHRRRHARGSRR